MYFPFCLFSIVAIYFLTVKHHSASFIDVGFLLDGGEWCMSTISAFDLLPSTTVLCLGNIKRSNIRDTGGSLIHLANHTNLYIFIPPPAFEMTGEF